MFAYRTITTFLTETYPGSHWTEIIINNNHCWIIFINIFYIRSIQWIPHRLYQMQLDQNYKHQSWNSSLIKIMNLRIPGSGSIVATSIKSKFDWHSPVLNRFAQTQRSIVNLLIAIMGTGYSCCCSYYPEVHRKIKIKKFMLK